MILYMSNYSKLHKEILNVFNHKFSNWRVIEQNKNVLNFLQDTFNFRLLVRKI